MGRKVFISFLGTNNYVETIYEFPDKSHSQPVRFIQEALILKHCPKWTLEDKVYIFCTDGSQKANWEDNGQKTDLDIEKIGLKHRLQDNFQLNSIVEMIPIEEGFSEEEVWRIFDVVYNKLDKYDEIFFDVTHAFRSIPLFSSVLFDYSRFMKLTKVVSIQYGAFEKLGPAFEVRKMPWENRVAPIIDLTNIIKLQQFTDMANAMLMYGRVNELSDLFKAEKHQALQKIGVSLANFDEFLKTNRLNDLKSGKWLADFYNNIKSLRKSNIPTPIKNIMSRLEEEFSSFVPQSDTKNIESAVAWTAKYDMILQSYTLGQEYMISLLSEKLFEYNFYQEDRERNFRMFISALFAISDKDVDSGCIEGKLADNIMLTKQILEFDWVQKIRPLYGRFSDYRNIVNHAKGTQKYSEIKKNFIEIYSDCINLIKSC